jgi:hypothetical protein
LPNPHQAAMLQDPRMINTNLSMVDEKDQFENIWQPHKVSLRVLLVNRV